MLENDDMNHAALQKNLRREIDLGVKTNHGTVPPVREQAPIIPFIS